MKRIVLVVCFAAIAHTFGAAAAQVERANLAKAEIKKWIDADGQVHYGDVPPPDANAAPLQVRPNVIEIDQPMPPTGSNDAPGKPVAPEGVTPIAVPAARPDLDRYVAQCRDNRGVDCEQEARQMIDGPAPVIFPGDPAVFPRPDVKPPPPGLPLKYGIRP